MLPDVAVQQANQLNSSCILTHAPCLGGPRKEGTALPPSASPLQVSPRRAIFWGVPAKISVFTTKIFLAIHQFLEEPKLIAHEMAHVILSRDKLQRCELFSTDAIQ